VKGILAMEGIPDHHEAFRSREALTGDLGARPHSPTRAPRPKAEDAATKQPPRRRGRREGERQGATGVSEARSQSVPWEENAHAREGRP
jgi:ferric-dicitrate binding protein FerR (iron transport regulator)